MIALSDIIIDPEFANLNRHLTEGERSNLLVQLSRYGFRDSLVVWSGHGILLDGHNRLEIWQAAFDSDPDKEPSTVELTFKDRESALQFARDNQRARRNLTTEEMLYDIGTKYDSTKGQRGGDRKSKCHDEPLVDAASQVAKTNGVSPSTVKRAAKFKTAVDTIAKVAGPEAKDRILSGDSGLTTQAVVKVAKLEPAEQKAAIAAPKRVDFRPVTADENLEPGDFPTEARRKFKDATRAVSEVAKLLEELRKSPYGIFAARHIRSGLRQIRGALKEQIPVAPCPYCEAGPSWSGTCACKKTGFVPQQHICDDSKEGAQS